MTPNEVWLYRLIYRHAWPWYECENCVGQGPELNGACYCAYHGAATPGVGPTRWHLFLRWLLNIRGTI